MITFPDGFNASLFVSDYLAVAAPFAAIGLMVVVAFWIIRVLRNY